MSRYKKFVLEAKLNSAPGFGHPSTDNYKLHKREKLTNDQIATWRARSEQYKKDYLKEHPTSRFKDIPAKGSIITRSKKISNKPWAVAMVKHGVEALIALGLKGKKLPFVKKEDAKKAVNEFVNAKDREPYVDKASDRFKEIYNKMSPEDQTAMDEEFKQINNSDKAPSRTILAKGGKGLAFGIVGIAVGAAIFGGLIPADVAVFLGVKVLDTAFEGVKRTVDEPLTAFLAAHSIRNFFNSRDSDDYASEIANKLGTGEDKEEIEKKDVDKEPEKSKEDLLKAAVLKAFGPDMAVDKYYLDDNGNLKLKRGNDGNKTT